MNTKVITMALLALVMAACPVACVNDPTQDDSTMPCTSTDEVSEEGCSVDVGDTGTAV